MPRPRPLALVLGLLAWVGCGGEPEPVPATAGVQPASQADLPGADAIELKAVSAEELLADLRTVAADLVVVNYWATWCMPCREEFPDLVRFDGDAEDVEVRFVSVDFEDEVPAVKRFLAEHGVTGTSYLKSGKDGPFINALNPDWSGTIPASFIYDRDGNRLDFWEGKVTYDELARRVERARART